MSEHNYIDIMCSRITQLRMQQGISAREMSLSLGQSESYINKIENRKSLPSLEAFFAICEFLNTEPKDLLCYDNAYPCQIHIAIGEMNKMNSDQLDRLVALMQDINGSKS